MRLPSDAEDRRQCIDACDECQERCVETAPLVGPRLRTLLNDCAQICQVTLDAIVRGSPFQESIRQKCAVLCQRCADACEILGGEALRRCAAVCRRCAGICRPIVGV